MEDRIRCVRRGERQQTRQQNISFPTGLRVPAAAARNVTRWRQSRRRWTISPTPTRSFTTCLKGASKRIGPASDLEVTTLSDRPAEKDPGINR